VWESLAGITSVRHGRSTEHFPHRPTLNINIVDHASSTKHYLTAAQTKKLREPNGKIRQRSSNKKTVQASQTLNNGVVEHTSSTKHLARF
jgi:hypothetical protein